MAHSMGGLVARSYIVNSGGDFDRLVTLGTPHLGIPPAVLAELGRKYNGFDQMKAGPRDLDPSSGFLKNLNRKDRKENYQRYVLFAGKVVPNTGQYGIPMPGFKHSYDKKAIALWTAEGPALLDNDALVHVTSAFIFPDTKEKSQKFSNPRVKARILTDIEHFRLNKPYPYGRNRGLNILVRYVNNGFLIYNEWLGQRKTGLFGENVLWTKDTYHNPCLDEIHAALRQPLVALQEFVWVMSRGVHSLLWKTARIAKKMHSTITIGSYNLSAGPVTRLRNNIRYLKDAFRIVQLRTSKNMQNFSALNPAVATFKRVCDTTWKTLDEVPTKHWIDVKKWIDAKTGFVNERRCIVNARAYKVKENLRKIGDYIAKYNLLYMQWESKKKEIKDLLKKRGIKTAILKNL